MRYEIFPSGARWRWRLVNDEEQLSLSSRSMETVEECLRAVDTERRATEVPVVLVEKTLRGLQAETE